MKSLNMKLVLTAVGLAMLATPALAQKQHRQPIPQQLQDSTVNPDQNYVGTYPNGALRSGSAESVQSGAEFNLLKN
jgi:hypothetical protein